MSEHYRKKMKEIFSWYAEHPWAMIPTVYLVMSLFTFIAYASDKRVAIRGDWRVSESTLHVFELLGGWPGALFAQKRLRHKCSKLSYQIEFYVMVALNLVGLAYVVYGMAADDWSLAKLRAVM